MARLILFIEDFSSRILYLTDLENNQLDVILKQLIFNDENGIGESIEDISKRIYPNNVMTNLGDTESSETDLINELNYYCVVDNKYYNFCEVKQ